MKKRYIKGLAMLVVVMLGAALIVGCSDQETNGVENNNNDTNLEASSSSIPQLASDERADADTMVVLGEPPAQPDDHIGRWEEEGMRANDCMVCHSVPATGARELPVSHFVNEDREAKELIGDHTLCINCHLEPLE